MPIDTWPRYQSHKIVQAKEIVGIINDGRTLVVDGGDEVRVTVTGMHARAKLGDYAVVYDAGYTSVSPKAVFETGYKPIPAPSGHS